LFHYLKNMHIEERKLLSQLMMQILQLGLYPIIQFIENMTMMVTIHILAILFQIIWVALI